MEMAVQTFSDLKNNLSILSIEMFNIKYTKKEITNCVIVILSLAILLKSN
jgi:hypothetical protein